MLVIASGAIGLCSTALVSGVFANVALGVNIAVVLWGLYSKATGDLYCSLLYNLCAIWSDIQILNTSVLMNLFINFKSECFLLSLSEGSAGTRAGHTHHYQRSWPVAHGLPTQRDYVDPQAPVYIVSGIAGAQRTPYPFFPPHFSHSSSLYC